MAAAAVAAAAVLEMFREIAEGAWLEAELHSPLKWPSGRLQFPTSTNSFDVPLPGEKAKRRNNNQRSHRTVGQNRKRHRINSRLINHCPTSSGVSEVSAAERVSEASRAE